VDDAELFPDSRADAAVTKAMTASADPMLAVVAAATSADLHGVFRGITVPLRRRRCGVLLSPTSPTDGELLGIRTGRAPAAAPGRGLLAIRGATTPLQIALP
jgi:S-DNA-T family DNA segregation ATPase FtsK/SpoIIIE